LAAPKTRHDPIRNRRRPGATTATRQLATVCLLLGLLASAGAAAGEDGGAAARGERLFRVYCASCHGDSGRGDGSLRAVLRVAPADLTELRRRAGGVFPWAAVERRLDGREATRGHGSQEMPVWGPTFLLQQEQPDAEEVRQRILDLVAFLRSIQQH
jgi:mono/diheme cytochrome c family protein